MGRSLPLEFSLLWVFPVAWRGWKKRIDAADDVPALPDPIQAKSLVPRARAYWAEEVQAAKSYNEQHPNKRQKRPLLFNVIWRLSRVYLAIGMVMSVIQGLVTTTVRPLLIRALVSELGTEDTHQQLVLVGYLALTLVLEGWSSVSLKHALSDHLGTVWVTSAACLIESKAMRIPSGTTTLQESSLLGNDVLRAYESLRFACIFPMSVIALIGGIIVLIITIGDASIIGLVAMVVILSLSAAVSKRAQRAEEEDLAAADKRLSLMTQVITGIKAIKLSAWEDSFQELLRFARKEEMVKLGLYRAYHQSTVQLGRACPVILAGCSFIYLAATSSGELKAADLFAALNVYLALRPPLIIIPESITYIGGFIVSFRRIETFLLLEEVPSASQENKTAAKLSSRDSHHGELCIKGDFVWHGSARGRDNASGQVAPPVPDTAEHHEQDPDFDRFLLRGVDITLPRGSKTAIIGDVGSGKSSLLAALADELKEISKAPNARNTFANELIGYVPQHAFILSGNIRDNITLCKTSNKESGQNDALLNKVLEKADMIKDLEGFPRRLDTTVGERGVTLSGGQQARVAIARALFQEPSLLLADDPLAAVDGAVADHLVANVIDNAPPGQTLVIAINQRRYLDHFDYMILMKRGRIHFFSKVTPQVLASINTTVFDHQAEEENAAIDLNFSKAKLEGVNTDHIQSICEPSNESRAVAFVDDDQEQNQHQVVDDTTSESHTGIVIPNENQAVTDGPAAQENHGEDDLVVEEVRRRGLVSSDVLKTYAKGMGYSYIFLALLLTLTTYTIMACTDLYLAAFVRNTERTLDDSMRFSIIYACGCVGYFIFLILTSVVFSRAGVRSSQHLHDHCIERILHAPVSWFEATPSGRIMSRFSTDFSVVDQILSRFVDNLTQLAATCLALIVVVCVIVPPVTIVILVSAVLYSIQVRMVDKSIREIQREATIAMSPIQTILSESVNGRISLRAMDATSVFQERFEQACDGWNRQSFMSLSMVNMSMLASYGLSFVVSTATGLLIVVRGLNPATAGLALTYALMIPYFAFHCAFIFTIVQTALASLERVLDFVGPAVPSEAAWRLETDPDTLMRQSKQRAIDAKTRDTKVMTTSPASASPVWPSGGSISFSDVVVTYRRGLEPALKGLSFKIRAGERCGVVGRTGSGKSTTIAAMLRIIEPTSGTIHIDGYNISSLGLITLREAFSIIPQQPLLIRGTVRKNLDPFGNHLDEALVQVLLDAELVAKPESALKLLDMDVGADASALSAGQRQLLSFARTLLRPGVIRVCDEPTSMVDETTDAAIQRVLRRHHGTTIVVAHRINTIIDSDRILVLHHGKMVEFDTPEKLLSNPEGHFHRMVSVMQQPSAHAHATG